MSVAVLVSGVADRVAGCLDALLDQDSWPGEVEIIFVDDGSVDGGDLVARFAPLRPDSLTRFAGVDHHGVHDRVLDAILGRPRCVDAFAFLARGMLGVRRRPAR